MSYNRYWLRDDLTPSFANDFENDFALKLAYFSIANKLNYIKQGLAQLAIGLSNVTKIASLTLSHSVLNQVERSCSFYSIKNQGLKWICSILCAWRCKCDEPKLHDAEKLVLGWIILWPNSPGFLTDLLWVNGQLIC